MLTFPKKTFENSNRIRNAVQVQAKVKDKQKCFENVSFCFSRSRVYLVTFFSVTINSLINHESTKHLSDVGKIDVVEFRCAQDF